MDKPQEVVKRSFQAERVADILEDPKQNAHVKHLEELVKRKNTGIAKATIQGTTMADIKPSCPPGKEI